MSYESKILIVDVHREKNPHSKNYGKVYYVENIATFDMSCMGYENGWRELFSNPIDYEVYVTSEDKSTKIDKYGEKIKSGNFDKIINWLDTHNNTGLHNSSKRITPLVEMLKGFNKNEWDDLQIIHFGY